MKVGINGQRRLAGALLLVGLSAAACGEQTAADPDGRTVATTAASKSTPESILQAFQFLAYDYTPVKSASELEGRAEIAIRGSIDAVVPGRIRGATRIDDVWAARSSGVAVRITESLKGPYDRGEIIWIELSVTPDLLQDSFVQGMPIEAYLVPAQKGTPEFPYGDDGSKIPSEAALWSPAHAQGIAVEYGDGTGTVTPLTHEVDPGESVSD
ncbi:hypothetical protein [Nocardioides caricicola]|uniref:Uncharacterized protein n=1 Tax=Nocardioides caricicola TaxID=634770 RepID=A0ABW0N0E9_9ACTN